MNLICESYFNDNNVRDVNVNDVTTTTHKSKYMYDFLVKLPYYTYDLKEKKESQRCTIKYIASFFQYIFNNSSNILYFKIDECYIECIDKNDYDNITRKDIDYNNCESLYNIICSVGDPEQIYAVSVYLKINFDVTRHINYRILTKDITAIYNSRYKRFSDAGTALYDFMLNDKTIVEIRHYNNDLRDCIQNIYQMFTMNNYMIYNEEDEFPDFRNIMEKQSRILYYVNFYIHNSPLNIELKNIEYKTIKYYKHKGSKKELRIQYVIFIDLNYIQEKQRLWTKEKILYDIQEIFYKHIPASFCNIFKICFKIKSNKNLDSTQNLTKLNVDYVSNVAGSKKFVNFYSWQTTGKHMYAVFLDKNDKFTTSKRIVYHEDLEFGKLILQ